MTQDPPSSPPLAFIPCVSTRYSRGTQDRVPTVDLSPIEQHGIPVELNRSPTSLDLKAEIAAIKAGLAERYRPERGDSIVCFGPPALIAVAFHVAASLRPERPVRLLSWDRLAEGYRATEVVV